MKITINNWEKYNPRKQRSGHTWFRLENEVAYSRALFRLKANQKWFWICLLSYASSKHGDTFEYDGPYFESTFGVSQAEMESAIDLLQVAGAIITHRDDDDIDHNIDDNIDDINDISSGDISDISDSSDISNISSDSVYAPPVAISDISNISSDSVYAPPGDINNISDNISASFCGNTSSGYHHTKVWLPPYQGVVTGAEGVVTSTMAPVTTPERVVPYVRTNERTNVRTCTSDDVRCNIFDFEIPYQHYPRKLGKAVGMRRLTARITNQLDYDAFCRASKNYAATCRVNKTEEKFIKHFSSFVGTKDNEPWREYVDADATPAPSTYPTETW